ncbi:hypothetical protein EJB05_14031, partial [Eragrostis curvula]
QLLDYSPSAKAAASKLSERPVPVLKLLGFDAGDLPQLSLLGKRCHLDGVGHSLLDLLECVLDLLLALHKPHEPCCTVVPELQDVLERQQALGETDLFEQLDRLLAADGVSLDDLCAGAVALNLGRHLVELFYEVISPRKSDVR